jgi:hypothetical protein
MLQYLEMCTQIMCTSALQPYPPFLSDFLDILQLLLLHDCQCYHIWKCAHRPCIYQHLDDISHFFLHFCIFYIYVSSLIANVTIFGNVGTHHVHISPPTSSIFFFLIFCIFYSCFSFMIANITIFGNVRTYHVHISPPTLSSFFF